VHHGHAGAGERDRRQHRGGDTREQILDAYAQLSADDIKAALKFAAEAVNNTDFIPYHRVGGQ
jgi:hypothetical protein